jgi:hypothetical protein
MLLSFLNYLANLLSRAICDEFWAVPEGFHVAYESVQTVRLSVF